MNKPRIEQLTFTRFIAAISIVIFHFAADVFPFKFPALHSVFSNANIGVSYFFILSGFVMMIAYGENKRVAFWSYLKGRFIRIYPAYLLSLLLLLVYIYTIPSELTDKGLLLSLPLLQSWIPERAMSLNFPSWSLSVELLFYVTFPFLFNYVYRTNSFPKLLLPVCFIWLVSQLLLHIFNSSEMLMHNLLYYFPLMHLNEFLIGNLAGLYFIKYGKGEHKNTDIFIFLLLIFLFLIMHYHTGLIHHNGSLAVIFVPLLLLVSVNNGWVTRKFSTALPVFLGEISYGIYIYQYPAYLWTKNICHKFNILHSTVIFYIFIVFLILLAALSYLYVETPIRKRWRSHTVEQES